MGRGCVSAFSESWFVGTVHVASVIALCMWAHWSLCVGMLMQIVVVIASVNLFDGNLFDNRPPKHVCAAVQITYGTLLLQMDRVLHSIGGNTSSALLNSI